jgi:hypothetical protein
MKTSNLTWISYSTLFFVDSGLILWPFQVSYLIILVGPFTGNRAVVATYLHLAPELGMHRPFLSFSLMRSCRGAQLDTGTRCGGKNRAKSINFYLDMDKEKSRLLLCDVRFEVFTAVTMKNGISSQLVLFLVHRFLSS